MQFRQQVNAVAVGQGQVEQHQIEGPFSDTRQAFLTGGCGIDLVAFHLEQRLQRLANLRFVVDDQDRARRGGGGLPHMPARDDGRFRH